MHPDPSKKLMCVVSSSTCVPPTLLSKILDPPLSLQHQIQSYWLTAYCWVHCFAISLNLTKSSLHSLAISGCSGSSRLGSNNSDLIDMSNLGRVRPGTHLSPNKSKLMSPTSDPIFTFVWKWWFKRIFSWKFHFKMKHSTFITDTHILIKHIRSLLACGRMIFEKHYYTCTVVKLTYFIIKQHTLYNNSIIYYMHTRSTPASLW